ncbi:hypothetical protein [Stenotrophomonas sp. PS02297]|uniref:hypothetical protein n=1 Tax=unclassified Stenotrophomonas TaxID=196198 RepID=UPI00249A4F66|nr:hypothetical protein [Stenotrophomonas sp. PS02297]
MIEQLGGSTSALSKLELALNQKAANGKGKIERDFKEAYQVFEQHMARKVRKSVLLVEFNAAYGHAVNLVQFRKLLSAEREIRSASGELVACESCRQPLLISAEDDANDPTEDAEDAR